MGRKYSTPYQYDRTRVSKDTFKRLSLKIIVMFTVLCSLFAGIFGYLYVQQEEETYLMIAGSCSLVAILLIVFLFWQYRSIYGYRTLENLRKMDPFEFERYICNLLNKYGYNCKVTPPRKDYSVDIVGSKDGRKMVAQVKRYSATNFIQSPDLMEFVGAMNFHQAEIGIYITTGFFAAQAREVGQRLKIVMIDADRLAKMINQKLK